MKKTLELKNNLRAVRTAKNLSQQELANIVGTTRQTIIAIEKNNFNPSVRLALLLATALDTQVEALFFF